MNVDVTKFLLSLGVAMCGVAQARAQTATPGMARELWILDANEEAAADPYSVLRNYGGPPPQELRRIERISVQLMTVAGSAAAGNAQARQFWDALFDDDDLPRHEWTFPAKAFAPDKSIVADGSASWKVLLVTPAAPPGLIGRDERGPTSKWNLTFNFDVTFEYVG